MYRPFVTCDDPKGVVECGTIRKSKHVVQKMEEEEHNNKKMMARHRHKNKGSFEEARSSMGKRRGDNNKEHYSNKNHNNPSSFQLLEVSKGAQKLNKVVDSWSKKGGSKDVGEHGEHGSKEKMAKDLLKGALDLKESLVMLGKLQEASKYMAKLKKKQQQKENPEPARIDGDFPSLRRVNSCREDGSGSGSGDYQKPRLSYDGASSSSGDYIDDLRNAITDSFARQNLLSDDERAWLDRRRGRGVETVAQDLSKAIIVHPSVSSGVAKKERSSNVIARLMGLEEIHPPESPPRIPQKRVDIEMPKLRKQQQQQQQQDALRVKAAAAIHEAHQQQQQQQRSLKELLDTMEFRGLLLKGSSVKKEEELRVHSQSNHRRSLSDISSTPPIVLIKPFHVPETKRAIEQPMVCEEEEVVSSNLHPGKGRVKENFSGRSQRIDQEEVKRIVNGKNRMMVERKLGGEEGDRKLISRENGGRKEPKEAVPRVKEGNSKSNNSKIRAGRPMRQEEKKEIVDKKVDKIQKMVASYEEVPVEKETVKVRNGTRTQDKAKVSRKTSNSEGGGIGSRSKSSQPQNAAHLAKGKKKEKKEEEEEKKLVDEAAEVILDIAGLREHKDVDLKGEIQAVEKESSSVVASAEQICRGEEKTSSAECPLEVQHCTEGHSPHENVPLKTSECRENVQSADSKARIQFKAFLLSNQEFLTRVEELFPLTVPSPNTVVAAPTTFDSFDEKLSLDYANELIKCKSNPSDSQARRHSLLLPSSGAAGGGGGALRAHFSLDQLVEEVCYGVETLKGYSNNCLVLGSGRQTTDSVNAILERDVKSTRTVSGVWESGWRNGFAADEAEQAVIDLETLILDQLIDEVFTT